MRSLLVRSTRGLFNRKPLSTLLKKIFQLSLKLDPALKTTLYPPSSPGAIFPLNDLDDALQTQLNEIPSQTSPAERKYLYHFFATLWAGQKNVCEVGPFLGGTTRAIALGMCANPRRSPHSKLYTYDRFRDYHASGDLLAMLEPLFQAGVLNDDAREEIQQKSFKEIFEILHQRQSYSSLVIAVDKSLPDMVNEIDVLPHLFRLDGSTQFDAVFVDGCKSWYATKYFMTELCACTEPGAYYLFQDYGWHTCFWIPVFMAVVKDYFRLISYVDCTYTFQLARPLPSEVIHALYPNDPTMLDKSFFDRLFVELLAKAKDRQDIHALVVYELQHAASLAYIGYREEAKAKIRALAARQYARKYRPNIEAALKSPTYLPGGQAILL